MPSSAFIAGAKSDPQALSALRLRISFVQISVSCNVRGLKVEERSHRGTDAGCCIYAAGASLLEIV